MFSGRIQAFLDGSGPFIRVRNRFVKFVPVSPAHIGIHVNGYAQPLGRWAWLRAVGEVGREDDQIPGFGLDVLHLRCERIGTAGSLKGQGAFLLALGFRNAQIVTTAQSGGKMIVPGAADPFLICLDQNPGLQGIVVRGCCAAWLTLWRRMSFTRLRKASRSAARPMLLSKISGVKSFGGDW